MPNKHIRDFFSEIRTVPAILQTSYYPSLNGLRGIAIVMVVLSHLALTSRYYYDFLFNGKTGVLVFFVLSGFLITTLCIKEKVITSSISLKNFYIRRALRIFPVAYLYILVIIILNLVFKLDIHYINITGAALYLMDFSSYFRKHHFSWFTGHYWSLAVEEQFYLFVPLILKKQFKLYLLLILFIVFVLPLFIYLQSVFPVLNTGILYAFTHVMDKFQGIAVGSLCSVLMFKYPIAKRAFSLKPLTNLLAVFLIIFLQYDDFFSLKSVFSGLVICFLIGYLIMSNINQGNDFIFRILNSKLLMLIGVLSYSMYIWQQIFTSNDPKLPFFMVTYPYNIFWIIVVSFLSYYCYEKFFLKQKARFTTVKKTAYQ